MAQSSRPFTNTNTNDGTSYTAVQWRAIERKTFGDGVLRGVGAELAVSGSASPLSVQPGAAWLDGVFFESTAVEALTVTTPAATTGGRVVVEVDYSQSKARLKVALSASGVTTPPALTQTSESLYQLSLATFTIAPNGAITLTDARTTNHMGTRVSEAMLDASIAGNGLSGGNGSPLAVNTDGSTLEIAGDALRVRNGGIGAAQLAGGAAAANLGYTPWGPGNDGAGSGLDADRIRGLALPNPQRFGGAAGDWPIAGSSTHSISSLQLFVGQEFFLFINQASKSVTYTLPNLAGRPLILASIYSAAIGPAVVEARSSSGTQVTIEVKTASGAAASGGVYVTYLVLGPGA